MPLRPSGRVGKEVFVRMPDVSGWRGAFFLLESRMMNKKISLHDITVTSL